MKRLLNKIGHWYLYDLKLQYKLMATNLVLILLPTVVLSLFLYMRLYDVILSDTILTEQALTSQTADTIEATLSQVVQSSDSLATRDSTLSLFSENSASMYSSTVKSRINSLSGAADSLIDGELVTAIRFYADDSFENIREAGESAFISDLDDVRSTYWYGIFSSTGASALFCPRLYLSVTEEETLGSLAYIQKIDTGMDSEVYLAVYFSGERLDSILASNVTMSNSATYILDDRDTVAASSSDTLAGAYYMSNSTISSLVDGENLYSTRTYLEDNLYVGYYKIGDTSWHLVSILSYESLENRGQSVVVQFMGVYILFFAFALILSIILSRSIASRIAKVIGRMQTVHHSRPEPIPADDNARDEIGDLINTYNYMSNEINDLLDREAKAAEEIKLQEFKALQSQINPHFLYNSLDMINWLSQIGEKKEVTEAVQALSRFYKLTLSKKDTKGNVQLELEHVSLYVKLQNMRYENRITLIMDVPDSLMDYELPKITLQPIVENSIQHGIMEKPEKAGTILITGWLEGESLVLLISDDGVGMTDEQLDAILDGEAGGIPAGGVAADGSQAGDGSTGGSRAGSGSSGGSNIGIYNTHARLRLLYGEGYGLHYESTVGRGTDTYIRVPAKRAGES